VSTYHAQLSAALVEFPLVVLVRLVDANEQRPDAQGLAQGSLFKSRRSDRIDGKIFYALHSCCRRMLTASAGAKENSSKPTTLIARKTLCPSTLEPPSPA